MAKTKALPTPHLTLPELIAELENALKHSTSGFWQKGATTHETVTETNYKIGSFHHANDAAFVDVMHAQAPRLIAALKVLLALQTNNKPNPIP